MCQTGGPRCYAHAKPAADRAHTAMRDAFTAQERHRVQTTEAHTASKQAQAAMSAGLAAGTTTVEQVETRNQALQRYEQAKADYRDAINAGGAAVHRYHDALADLAASPRGAEELPSVLAEHDPDGNSDASMQQRSVAYFRAAGEYQRTRGAILRKISDGGVEAVAAFTGDPHTDTLIRRAFESYVQHPADHRQPPEQGQPLVKNYTSAQDKARGVARWHARVLTAATDVHRAEQRIEQALTGRVPASTASSGSPISTERLRIIQDLKDDHHRKQSALVLLARKLKIAQDKQVPTVA